jgi:hypothetical protein
MALQFSTAVRNARLDAIESTIGTAPILEIRSGSPPANCAAADTGTLLASMTLPSDWMAAASNGSKVKAGTWEDLTANAGAWNWRWTSTGVSQPASAGQGSFRVRPVNV